MKGICLCSGGLDSTLALAKLLEDEHQVVPMFVDYNQYPAKPELTAFSRSCLLLRSYYKTDLLKPVQLRADLDYRELEKLRIGSVWGRGIALVGLAAMWTYTHGNDYDFIALGNHKGDVGPDCKPGEFDFTLDTLLDITTKSRIHLETPIRYLTVEDIGKELTLREIPLDILYSCYWDPPCGFKSKNEDYRCPGCRRKTIAMKAVGITDADALNFPNGKERSYQSSSAEKTGY